MNNFVYLSFILCIFPICMVHAETCTNHKQLSGEIAGGYDYTTQKVEQCWTIEVPRDSRAVLDLKSLKFTSSHCYDAYIKISVPETDDTYQYCVTNANDRKPITALGDVDITLFYSGAGYQMSSSFNLHYSIESLSCEKKDHIRCSPNVCILQHQVCDGVKDCEDGSDEVGCENEICAEEDHFRCSRSFCIYQHQVCDGVDDCENGIDEVECEEGMAGVRGVKESREHVITWLKHQRSTSFGWGKNTHRAITALYLANAADFTGQNLEEELTVKQLELQTAVALLRNATDPVSVGELSMFVNALTVTCHNPRKFYGYDLLQILGDRVSVVEPPSPSAYLTLCNSNWSFSEHDVKRLLTPLQHPSKYPFISDIQAIAVMALTCIKNKPHNFVSHTYPSSLYESSIKAFIQLPDGSFGNVYTTALVSQALIASGQEDNEQWNFTATARYLMQQLNSTSIDFLSASLTLPVFSGRSLVDVANVDCRNITRTLEEDSEITDIMNKLGGKMSIQYSLYVGDQKEVIHTIILRLPNKSSAFDVMRIAQVGDPKYKFLHLDVSGQMYVYEIAGITNDPEAGRFWQLYTQNDSENEIVEHLIESPDKIMLRDNDHLIMWYKTADYSAVQKTASAYTRYSMNRSSRMNQALL